MGSKQTPTCAVCSHRRPRRSCPGIRADICPICCGESREATIDCPLDCIHLQDARLHEKPAEPDPAKAPNQDVNITERFASENIHLFNFLAHAVIRHTLATPGAVDNDVRETLDALARTYRTLESGLIYETRPANLLAAGLQQRLREELSEYAKRLKESAGMETMRDADILGVLVMLQRMEYARNNGRARGRAFIDFLVREFSPSGDSAVPPSSGGLIVPA